MDTQADNQTEIKITLDLAAIISAAVAAERVQPLIDKAITEAVKSAITDATGYNSKFREELKRQLAEALPRGLAIDDVAKFQQLFNRTVSDVVHGANAASIQAALRDVINSVIPRAAGRIKMSELLQEARRNFVHESNDEFYALLKMSDYGGGWLYLDRNSSCASWHRASICIAFTNDGNVYSLKLDGQHLTPKSAPDIVGKFDGLLLSMYVGLTSLELDCDEGAIEYAAAAQHD